MVREAAKLIAENWNANFLSLDNAQFIGELFTFH